MIWRMKKASCHHSLSELEAKEILRGHGINRTKVKLSTLTALATSHSPLSIADIHEEIGSQSCDISTVFRTITQFKSKGLVRELNIGEDFCRYEFIKPGHDHHHHHHVRCRSCGDIQALAECDLAIFEKSISRLGFTQLEHNLEFVGTCKKCY